MTSYVLLNTCSMLVVLGSHDTAQLTLACGHPAVAKAVWIYSTVFPCSVAGTEAGAPTVNTLRNDLDQAPLAEEASLLTITALPAAGDIVQRDTGAGTCRCVTSSNRMLSLHLARVWVAASVRVFPVACRHQGILVMCTRWYEVGSKLVGCPVSPASVPLPNGRLSSC